MEATHIHVVLVNEDKNCRNYDELEEIAVGETQSSIYLHMKQEYGKCTSRIYIDKSVPMGWSFQKRVKYWDSNDTFLQTAWITLVRVVPRQIIACTLKE